MLNNMLVTANQFFDVFIHVFNASSFEGFFIVFGLIIICYIVVGMLDDNFFQNRALQKRTAMIVGFVPLIAVLLLQFYWMATKADKLSLYESNLQLVLIFYFLLMFNTKIQVYVDSALAIVLTGIFILASPDYFSGSSLFIGLVGLIMIIITMYIIQKYAQKIVASWSLQVVAVLFFANAWWLMLSLSEDVSVMLYIALVLKFIFFISIILGINQIIVRRWQKYQQMMDELNKDFLTGIFNREAFDEDFTTLFIESNQTNFDWTFIMFDIDNFKSLNDNYGHLMGDEVLKEVTKTVQETVNHSYIGGKLYRLGGEEFGILIRKQDHERIEQLVRQIGSEIHSIDIKRADFDVRLSISMGMTMFRVDSDANVRQIYDRADRFVYYSKQHGKDALTDEGNLIHFE